MKHIARSAIVEHSAAQMYALVDDIETYPRFLPWCLEARVAPVGDKKRATLNTAGERSFLEDAQRARETERAEKAVSAWCGS